MAGGLPTLCGDAEVEPVEDVLLERGRAREQDDRRRLAEADGVAGEGGEILQQGAEAVHRAGRRAVRLGLALVLAAVETWALGDG